MKKSRKKPDDNLMPIGVTKKRAHRKQRSNEKNIDKKRVLSLMNNEVEPKREVLDIFDPQRKLYFKPISKCKNIRESVDLNQFSFIDNPVGTMRMIIQIIRANSQAGRYTINYNDPICLDMAPYIVLSLIKNDLDKNRLIGGTITHHLRNVLKETEFYSHLNMKDYDSEQVKDLSDKMIWPMKLMKCKESESTDPKDYTRYFSARHDTVADKYVAEIENWIKDDGHSLNKNGMAELMLMFSEILDNAIVHNESNRSDKNNKIKPNEAWISGFMRKIGEDKDVPFYICHISILNMGNSIYQSMQNCSDEIKNRINELVKMHRSKFRLRKYWTEEALWTLYALQDGVSSKYEDGKSGGGMGLMDMIEKFSLISQPQNSDLAIISGNVALNISNPKPKKKNDLRYLTLNSENDINLPPNHKYVKLLKIPFPGTILSWRFLLNTEYLE